MSLDPILRACMNQTIVVAPFSGVSDSGDPKYGSRKSVDARVEPKRSIVLNARGEQVMSDYMIYTEERIGLQDRIWLPSIDSSDDRMARLPKRVFEGIDEDGTTWHFEVAV